MNDTLEGTDSRITEAEKQINGLEDRTVEITAAEQKIEKRMKRIEDSLRDLSDNDKHTNICIIGALEGQKRDKEPEKIFEVIVAENFPNMGEEIANQVQKAQSPRQVRPKEEHTKTHSNKTGKN